jgi:hypothetical protein
MLYTHRMKNSNPEFTDEYVESVKQEYDSNGCIKFEGVITREEALELGKELKALIESKPNNAQWKGDFMTSYARPSPFGSNSTVHSIPYLSLNIAK